MFSLDQYARLGGSSDAETKIRFLASASIRFYSLDKDSIDSFMSQ